MKRSFGEASALTTKLGSVARFHSNSSSACWMKSGHSPRREMRSQKWRKQKRLMRLCWGIGYASQLPWMTFLLRQSSSMSASATWQRGQGRSSYRWRSGITCWPAPWLPRRQSVGVGISRQCFLFRHSSTNLRNFYFYLHSSNADSKQQNRISCRVLFCHWPWNARVDHNRPQGFPMMTDERSTQPHHCLHLVFHR